MWLVPFAILIQDQRELCSTWGVVFISRVDGRDHLRTGSLASSVLNITAKLEVNVLLFLNLAIKMLERSCAIRID